MDEATNTKNIADGTPIPAESIDSKEDSRSRNVRSFVKNGVMLSTIGIAVSLLGLVYRIYIARYLGDTQFGVYVFLITFVSYFSVVSFFGFRQVIIRQVAAAKDRNQVAAYAAVGLRLRLISSTAAVLIAVALAMTLKRTESIQLPAVVCALSLLTVALSDMFDAVFLGMEKTEYSAISAIIANVVKLAVSVLLLTMGYGLLSIFIVFAATSLLNLVLNWILLRFKCGIKPGADRKRRQELTRFVFHESLPFVYTTLISKVYYKNDILVLGWLQGDQVVGWYGGAYMAIDFLQLVGGAVANAVYPIMSRMHAAGSESLLFSYQRLSKYIFLILVPICVATSLVAASFLPLVLGDRFSNGIDALQVLIWIIPFDILALVVGSVLSATGNQKLIPPVAVFSAISNLGLTLALVPGFSYMGAAWASVIAAILNIAATQIALKKVLPRANLPRVMWRPVIAACAMAAVIFSFRGAHSLSALVVGIVVYVIGIVLLRTIDTEDMKLFSETLASIKQIRTG